MNQCFFTSYKIRNMFKVNDKDTRIHKVNDKVKKKDTVDVVLACLLLTLLTLNTHFTCYIVSIVDFDQLIAGWGCLLF